MDLISTLGSTFTTDQLKVNTDIANGKNIWFDMMEADYQYTMECNAIIACMEEMNNAAETVDFFSLENYEAGIEGFISDAWFKFIQFVKKVVAHVKVMFNHFWSGINRKQAYLEDMKIKLRGSSNFNWLELRDTELIGYNPERFHTVLKMCEKIETVLEKVFKNSEFNLDDIRDFVIYGIEFENGLVKKDGVKNEYLYDAKKFNLGLEPNADKSLGLLGWTEEVTLKMLEQLLGHLQFHNQKDYLFIKFQYATEALIRQKENDKSYDRDQITRLRNTIQTTTSMMLYLTKLINTCTDQMIRMCHALEKKEVARPKQEVEW